MPFPKISAFLKVIKMNFARYDQFKKAVNEEVKSQRMKSELITNVSHDLKTPLTAIITYINLLKDPGVTEEQKQEYLSTLDKKAVRLKTLIEDLFEVSKATTNNITLNYANVDICNLIRQCYLEYQGQEWKSRDSDLNSCFRKKRLRCSLIRKNLASLKICTPTLSNMRFLPPGFM